MNHVPENNRKEENSPQGGHWRFTYNQWGVDEKHYLDVVEHLSKNKITSYVDLGANTEGVCSVLLEKIETGLKFIDPRGKIGEEFSIFGDVYYDFAKVYQSIIGYDFILNDLDFSFEYQEKIRTRFESNFPEAEIRIIKNIAASLLFSLIPLHFFSEDKFNRYIKIIKNLL